MSVTRGHPDHSLFSFQLLPSIHLFHSSIFASLVRVRIPRIFLGFSQSREDEIGNFQYSNDLGRKVGYLGTRVPLKRVLRPASDHHLPCSLLPFSFDSSLAAAPPSISQFLASENFFFLAPFPRRTIFKFKNALSILSRNRIFFASPSSDFPIPTFLKERKKFVKAGLVSENDVTRLRENYLYFAPRRIPRMRESKVLRTFSVGQRPITAARSTYYAIP